MYSWETPVGTVYDGDEIVITRVSSSHNLGRIYAYYSSQYTKYYDDRRSITFRYENYNYGNNPDNCHTMSKTSVTGIVSLTLIQEPEVDYDDLV